MHIAILGLSYVGTTTAACLLNDGYHVYGIDINPGKVEIIAAGRSPVVEPEDAGYDLRVFDPDLDPDRLIGVNFALAAEHQEVLRQRLMRDLDAATAGVGLVVLGKSMADAEAALPPALPRLDVTRLRSHTS